MKFNVPPEVIDKLFNQSYEDEIVDIVIMIVIWKSLIFHLLILVIVMKKIILSSKIYQIYNQLLQRMKQQKKYLFFF